MFSRLSLFYSLKDPAINRESLKREANVEHADQEINPSENTQLQDSIPSILQITNQSHLVPNKEFRIIKRMD